MRELSFIQELLSERRVEKRAEGRFEGKVEEARRILRLQGERRLGKASKKVLEKIDSATSVSLLESPRENILVAESCKDLFTKS